MIADARAESSTGEFGFHDEWQSAISRLRDEDLADFATMIEESVRALASPRMFSAYVLHARDGEDFGFARYCEWVLSHGREVFGACCQDPQFVSGKEHPRCRWQDTNLYQSVLMFIGIRARFRPTVTVAKFEGGPMRNPALQIAQTAALGVCPEYAEHLSRLGHPSEIDSFLRLQTGVTKESAAQELPALAKGIELAAVGHPLVDRRTPMTIHKFWEVMRVCRGLGGGAKDLRAVIGVLPSAQVAQFHELLRACFVSAVASALGPHLTCAHCPEALLFSVALEGQEAYRRAVATGNLPDGVEPSDPTVLDVAKEVFAAQTGMDLPPLVVAATRAA